jgi:hypothetical protein
VCWNISGHAERAARFPHLVHPHGIHIAQSTYVYSP